MSAPYIRLPTRSLLFATQRFSHRTFRNAPRLPHIYVLPFRLFLRTNSKTKTFTNFSQQCEWSTPTRITSFWTPWRTYMTRHDDQTKVMMWIYYIRTYMGMAQNFAHKQQPLLLPPLLWKYVGVVIWCCQCAPAMHCANCAKFSTWKD